MFLKEAIVPSDVSPRLAEHFDRTEASTRSSRRKVPYYYLWRCDLLISSAIMYQTVLYLLVKRKKMYIEDCALWNEVYHLKHQYK